jgi:hypothetical protein
VKLKLSQDDSQKHPQNTRWQAGGFSLIMDKKMINTYHSCSGSSYFATFGDVVHSCVC